MTNDTHQINKEPCTFPTGISFLYTMATLVDYTANILCRRALYNMHHSVHNISHRLVHEHPSCKLMRCQPLSVVTRIVPHCASQDRTPRHLHPTDTTNTITNVHKAANTSRRCYVRLHWMAFQETRVSV